MSEEAGGEKCVRVCVSTNVYVCVCVCVCVCKRSMGVVFSVRA